MCRSLDLGDHLMASTNPVCRPFSEGDEGAINRAFEDAFGSERSLDEWAWKFPPEEDGRAIMLTEEDGEVVAHCAGVPVSFSIDGHIWRGARVVDVFFRPLEQSDTPREECLARTIEAFYREFGRSGHFSLMYGFQGLHPDRFEKMGLGDCASLNESVLSLVRRPPSFSSLRRLRYRAELARDWEPRLDDLWRRVCHSYPVAVVRDASHALYRLAGHPTVRYHRFLLFPRIGSRAVAYAAYSSDGNRCRWVDLLWDHRHPGALRLLSHLSAKIARQTGAEVEELWLNGDPEGRAHLEALGFRNEVDCVGPIMVARAFDHRLDLAELGQRIYLTMADTDQV